MHSLGLPLAKISPVTMYFKTLPELAGQQALFELNRAAASMIHGSPQNPKEVIPKAGAYTMADQQTAFQLKPLLIAVLTQQFKLTGDRRLQNPDQVVTQIVDQSFRTILPNYDVSGTDPFREFVSKFLRVDLSRLPPKATQYDFVMETLFRSRM